MPTGLRGDPHSLPVTANRRFWYREEVSFTEDGTESDPQVTDCRKVSAASV